MTTPQQPRPVSDRDMEIGRNSVQRGIRQFAEEIDWLRAALAQEREAREQIATTFQAEIDKVGRNVDHFRARAEALEKEREEARRWGEDLARRAREVTCVWCGHQFESTLGSQAEYLLEHAKVCEKHPIHSMSKELARMRRMDSFRAGVEAAAQACEEFGSEATSPEAQMGHATAVVISSTKIRPLCTQPMLGSTVDEELRSLRDRGESLAGEAALLREALERACREEMDGQCVACGADASEVHGPHCFVGRALASGAGERAAAVLRTAENEECEKLLRTMAQGCDECRETAITEGLPGVAEWQARASQARLAADAIAKRRHDALDRTEEKP